ncbi:MAG: hypothetical protein CV089_11440 [Nitrospira sp. WS110]|nr:hypothetical protein [Nitrospira sp. WS110]
MAKLSKKIKGTAPSWNWKVEAKGGRGKKQAGRSPETKIRTGYGFIPDYSGTYRFSIPIHFSGLYEIHADQVGAGGRQAAVEISIISIATHRGKRIRSSKTIFKKKVTKGHLRGPFKFNDIFSWDIDAWVGTKPEETRERQVGLSTRVELYAFAKWHKSRALLNFVRPGSAGIKFGTATVTLEKAKPRKGEQAPPGYSV